MHCLTLMLLLVIPLQAGDPAPPQAATAELPAELPTIEVRTKSLQPVDGFLKVYLDDDAGTVLAELPESPADFLYVSGLSSGLGSNPVGLDRGQWGRTRLVRTRRAGRRMYFIEQNMSYRATADRAAEQRAVDESFADSVFWSTDILARTGGRVLIDLRTLLLRDAHNVAARLKSAGQGDYSFKDDLSFIELERCRAFPRNTELSALVTYGSGEPGSLMAATAADGRVFSLRLHHSFVKLPEPGYTPRRADPRVASITVAYADYSAPLDRPLESRLICRHRLQKANPKADISAPVQPIVYYLDPGTPQPVRDALLDGARWWNAAFEAAGYRDAFRVELLPDDADPMDAPANAWLELWPVDRGSAHRRDYQGPRAAGFAACPAGSTDCGRPDGGQWSSSRRARVRLCCSRFGSRARDCRGGCGRESS